MSLMSALLFDWRIAAAQNFARDLEVFFVDVEADHF
jgi:hypothetical protein